MMLMMMMRPRPPPPMHPHNPFLRIQNTTTNTTNYSSYPAQNHHLQPPPLSPTLFPRLPMLSPHLLSPLPALTPGDNTWANPLDVIPPVSAPPPAINGDNGQARGGSMNPPLLHAPPAQAGAPPAYSQHIPPSPPFHWPPSLPCSPLLSPGFFPSSPAAGFGLPHRPSLPLPNGSTTNFNSPREFTFQGPIDYGIFKPS